MKFPKEEALGYETRLKTSLELVRALRKEMDVVAENPTLTREEKLEELKKIKEELNKVTLEIDSVKKGIKMMSTRHLN